MLALATSAHAAPFLWDGGGVDNNWSTANNWVGNSAPSVSANDYGFSGSVRLAPNADGATAWAVTSLVFTPDAGAFTLTGTTLNLGAAGIVNKSTANQTIANAIALQASTVFSTATTGGLSLGGLISGASGFNKTGPGTLTLAGANTYTGVTTISAGTVALGAAGGATATPLGTTAGGTIVRGTGAALDLRGFTLGTAEAVTLIGTGVNGTGALTNSGAAASFSGVVTLSSNTATNGAAIGGSGAITLSAGLTGDFNLTKVGTGTLTLNGASTRAAGNTSVDLGTLKLGSATALGTTATPLILKGGTLDLALDTSVSAYATTLAAGSTITTGRATAGAGVTQTLGTLSANSSTLTVNTQDTTVTSGTAGLTFGATTLTGNPTFNVVNGTAASTVLTLGALTDTGTPRSLTKTGSGTLTLGSAATSLTNGTTVTVSGGTLNSNNATALGSLANLTVTGAGATFGVGATQTVGALNGAGGGTVSLGANTLTVGSAANNLTSAFTGTLTGTGGLTKAGNGSLTLAGNNTYSGLTTVSAGTLQLGSAGDATNTPLGTTGGATTVSATGALNLNGFTLGTAEALTLNGSGVRSGGALTNTGAAATWSGTVALGSATSLGGTGNILLTGVVSGAGPLTKVGANTLTLQGANTHSSTVTILGGGLTLSGANGALANASGYTLRSGGTLTLDNTTNNTNRLDAVAFGANGGNFVFTHGGTAATNYLEITGNLSINSGGLNLTTSQAAAGQTSALTFKSNGPVTPPTRTAGGTVMFSGPGFGASTRNTVAFGAAPTLSTSTIIPWAAIDDNGTYSFATYNATGFTSVKPVTSTATAVTSWTSAINARPTADLTLTGARTVGSLILDSGIDILDPVADRNLTIASGALMQTGGTSLIEAIGNSENVLNFGAVEGILTTIGTLTLQRGNANSGITGSAGITKTGPGTFINFSVNANTGPLTINDGTYRGVTQAGTISAGGVTANKGTLEVASDTSTTFTNTATTINGDFTLKPDRATSGSGSGLTQTIGTVALNHAATLTVAAGANVTTAPITLSTGAVTLGATDATINTSGPLTALTLASITGAGNNLTVTGDGNTAVTGAITTGTGTLTKEGSGNLTLNGVNTFTGLTTVNAGTLTLGQATDTFAATAPVTVNGGTLALGANSDTLGAVTLQAGSITGSTGVLTPASLDVQSGAISAIVGGTGTLTKSTSGTVTLTGANTYTGTTTIQTGTLAVGDGGTTGSIAAGSAIVNNGTLSFNRSDALSVTNTLSGNGDLIQAGTGTLTLSGTNTSFAGAVTVNSGSTLKLTTTAALGTTNTAGTTVTSGGVLQLDSGATPANGTLTLAGTGIANGGALVAVATGFNRWAGDVTLAADTTVTNNGAAGLALGTTSTISGYFRNLVPAQTPVDTHTTSLGAHTLTLNGTGPIYLNGRLTGTGNINVSMGSNTAIAEYAAFMNTFTGTTTITRGVLTLYSMPNNYPGDPVSSSFFGINGPLVIGDGHATNTATFNSGSYPDQLNFTTPVTLYSNGTWNLGSTQTIASLTMTGGAIALGTSGGLYLDGNLTTNAAATAATISGSGATTLSLTPKQGGAVTVANATRTFTVADGAAASDLTLDVTTNNGSFIKAGLGTMTILNNNSGGYEGTTAVNGGILNIRNANALGLASNEPFDGTTVNGTGTTALAGTTVGTGAANGSLQLQHPTGLNVALEQLTLNGTGYLNNGALQNVSGNNTWSGIVTLGSAARIQSDANTLTLSTTSVSGTNTDLDVRGAGNTTITAGINTGDGGLTKNGTGTLTLNGVGLSTYTGNTTINTGVVSLQTAGGLGATTSGTTVAAGAALELSNATYGGNLVTSQEPLTLAGTGLGGTGALLNRSGTNTFSGLVTLNGVDTVAGATLITAVTGQPLTLSGGTSATTQALTVGTTAENGNVVISGNVANGTSELSKNGSGSLSFSGTLTKTGNVNLNLGTLAFTGTSATVDQVHLLGGAGSTLSVGSGTTLTTDEFDASPLSTLNIASGGTVIATYGTGTTTTFSGQLAGTGTFKALGGGTVIFDQTSLSASLLNVYLGGTSVGTNADPLTFSITNNAQLTFNNLHITGDTILDFGNSSASVLTSANLYVAANVLITVQNWISMVDAWFVTGSSPGFSGSTLDRTGSTPENQITFTGFSNNSTAWINQYTYGDFNQNEIRPVLVPIPEPSTYGALLVSGCGALLAYRRFRRRRPGASPSDPA